MKAYLLFENKDLFRLWLEENYDNEEGLWLLFGKKDGPVTLTPDEALDEALCFGWIDGVMKRIDDTQYKKYFSQRRKNSNWSAKNKKTIEKLIAEERMTDAGMIKINEAKTNGQWDKVKNDVTAEDIAEVIELFSDHEPAYTHFKAMSPSVQKTYTRAYLDAKTDAGREKRYLWMLDRLTQNLKPM